MDRPTSTDRPAPPALPADITLRTLRWEDFEPLVRTYFDAYDERDRGEPIGLTLFHARPSASDEVNWFASAFRKSEAGDEIHVIADRGGVAVGHCAIAPASPIRAAEQGHVGVLGILVDRSVRSQGVGAALLEEALRRARGQYDVVKLGVFASNERAHWLYEWIGFRDFGRLPKGIKRGGEYTEEVHMWVDLAAWSPPAPREKR
jgi:RimJ/RimL family protein N-acetyltransferase